MELDLISYHDVEATEDIVKVTTFAILTGMALESWAQCYWTRTMPETGYAYAITPYPLTLGLNNCESVKTDYDYIGIRPVLKLTKDEFQQFKGKDIVTFGEYPQGMVWDSTLDIYLDKNIDTLSQTGRRYTYLHRSKGKQETIPLVEYSYQDKKYVTMISNNYYDYDKKIGMKSINITDHVWFKVEPVEWTIDESKQMLIATKVLLGGVPFDNSYYADSYSKSYIKMFLKNYMEKEMFSKITKTSLLESDDTLKDYFLKEKRRQLVKGKKG